MENVFDRVENIVGKGEKCWYIDLQTFNVKKIFIMTDPEVRFQDLQTFDFIDGHLSCTLPYLQILILLFMVENKIV